MNDSSFVTTIQVFQRQLEAFKIDADAINAHINIFKRQIEELQKRPEFSTEFSLIKKNMDTLGRLFNDSRSSWGTSFTALKNIATDLEKEINDLRVEQASLSSRFESLENSIGLLTQSFNQKNDKLANDILDKLKTSLEIHSKKIDELRIEFTTSPKAIVDANEAMIKKLESATLDGANAILKVNNVDLAVRMLERKIENVALQVKKFELTQQGG